MKIGDLVWIGDRVQDIQDSIPFCATHPKLISPRFYMVKREEILSFLHANKEGSGIKKIWQDMGLLGAHIEGGVESLWRMAKEEFESHETLHLMAVLNSIKF